MVYDVYAMLSIKIDTPTWRHAQFIKEENKKGLRRVIIMIDESHNVAHIREFAAKQRAFKVVLR